MQLSGYNIGLRGHDIGDDFKSMCAKAVENNIQHIQFAMAKTMGNINFDVMGYDETLAQEVNERLRKCNLSVTVLGCYINPIDSDEERRELQLQRFEAFIKYASMFKADVVGTETGRTAGLEYAHYKETYQLFMRNLARLVDTAEQYDVNIGIEPVYCDTVCSPQLMQQVINDIQSDRVRVILDLSNLLAAGTISSQRKILEDSFDLFGDRISTIHLKDFQVVDGKKCFAAPGEGLMDISYLLERLSYLKHKPNIILDNLSLNLYQKALETLAPIFVDVC